MSALAGWLERRQVAIYLAGIGVGVVVGLLLPGVHGLTVAIDPALALLLYATFLGVPFLAIGRAVVDARFLATVLVMLAQAVLLPGYLLVMVGPSAAQAVDVGPFARAFVVLIVLPLVVAAATQTLGDRAVRYARRIETAAPTAMVPLVSLTLAVVVASQIRVVSDELGALLGLVPLYLAFAVVMVALVRVLPRWGRPAEALDDDVRLRPISRAGTWRPRPARPLRAATPGPRPPGLRSPRGRWRLRG
ncbi:Arsenite efflux pump ArsB, ACR3 family [Quadrisphaera granulorum]|uniref:ACR3 family arsenite efflux pump ArsB n=1 Tax=Quadrisphaera granulorum TaxID=317664 RepID=A0A316AWB9_9ACTN|nr:hypothetical protein [Quadrisphaera granulorum]PWJ54437.1 ACR3 family arsenite efflux pump ArsB [Quadrisphaera granulorum]SZE96209.1 Arsenite efflux pump ArsB, ACR3 family [Quadrisphaera granulorum]